MNHKIPTWIFFILVCAALISSFVMAERVVFPFLTGRAFFLRAVIELAAPFYFYLILADRRNRPNLKNPLTLAVVGFFLASVLAAIFGANVSRSIWGNYERMSGVWQLLHMAAFYFYLLLLPELDRRFLPWFLKLAVLSAVIAALYGVWVVLGLPRAVPEESLPRVSSTFGNPIFFAGFLILPLFLTAFFALQAEKRRWKIVYSAAALLQVIGILLSGTRGALVGLAFAFLVGVFVYLLRAKLRQAVKLTGLAAVIGIVILAGGLLAAHSRFSPQSRLWRLTNFNDSNTQSRLLQWKTAFKGFKDYPVLGVGPENYYVISNKYFTPQFYRLDSSWFDKPHNYLLEVLATTGLIGFLGYLSILVFSVWAFFKAYKKDFISWAQFCVLLAGIICYQIQNLFAFDTISPTLMFFIFLGFGGYSWTEAKGESRLRAAASGGFPAAAKIAAGVAAVFVAASFYYTLWSPAKAAYDIVFGMSIGISNPYVASDFFTDAEKLPFIFERGDLGLRFVDFAANLAALPENKVSKDFVNQNINEALAVMEGAAKRAGNNPIYWYTLAKAYFVKAGYNKQQLDPPAVDAVNRAVQLVPERIQALYFEMRLLLAQGKTVDALRLARHIVDLSPNAADTHWWLALAYNQVGLVQSGVQEAEIAVALGYHFQSVSEMQWITNYYAEIKNYPRVLELYQQEVALSPGDFQLYANLATAYAAVGNKEKARETAQKVIQLNPDYRAEAEAFIKSLH